MIDLRPGDIIIPQDRYQYCYEVERLSTNPDGWWKTGYAHVTCTRMDIDAHRKPVRDHLGKGHIAILKQIGPLEFEEYKSAYRHTPPRKFTKHQKQLVLF